LSGLTSDPRPLLYLAGPLFNEAERAFNERLCEFVESLGFQTFLPQRDAGESAKLIDEGMPAAEVRARIFDQDRIAVETCDVFLLVLDGRVPDEGACVELGMAFSLGKPCIGFQTDSRRFSRGFNNAMIDGCLTDEIAWDWVELRKRLKLHIVADNMAQKVESD
jgi:nucleoside 2-deoxyribosyltransferase